MDITDRSDKCTVIVSLMEKERENRSKFAIGFDIYQVNMKHLSHPMRKQTMCIGENKGADQLRGNREADQRLCFRYTDSTIALLSKSKISSL